MLLVPLECNCKQCVRRHTSHLQSGTSGSHATRCIRWSNAARVPLIDTHSMCSVYVPCQDMHVSIVILQCEARQASDKLANILHSTLCWPRTTKEYFSRTRQNIENQSTCIAQDATFRRIVTLECASVGY